MIGKKLAHYEIIEQLGKGGMGEVYRARDTRLGRDVALKILPAELSSDDDRRKRFEREAQAIAALKHPNIVTIYAVEEAEGQQFISMELVEGETLAAKVPEGGLTLDRLFEYAVPLIDAVASAHEQGITHRDLKPANIMFDRDGRLKVLDFGLAKLLTTDTADDGATMAMGSDTAVGVIMGTAAYMSPEQAEGKTIDHRSDIFSLGILLYEMATGARPFQGDTKISTISAILKDQPKLVSDMRRQLPRHLGRIVNRCLEKNPEERYQSAKDVRTEIAGLKREVDSDVMSTMEHTPAAPPKSSNRGRRGLAIGALVVIAVVAGIWAQGRKAQPATPNTREAPEGAAQERPSAMATGNSRKMVVVLPFENLGTPDDAYFAAGMTDEITSRISSVGDIGVISRSSATQYDRTGKTMRQIGADLGVDYVLEGTVRWAKQADGTDRVRITPQLIRVSNDSQMWSQAYDREIDDVFEVQTEIANTMIKQLGITLTEGEREQLDTSPTASVEAYKLYLRAQDAYKNDFINSDSLVIALIDQAVTLDPDFVAAWAWLAAVHMDWYAQWDQSDERLSRARRALRRAEALDPDHVETHVARGNYQYYGFNNFAQALQEFEAAAQLSPSHALARLQIGNIHRRLGNMESAIENQKMAILLDPQVINHAMQLAASYAGMRRFAEAEQLMLPVLEAGGSNASWAANQLAKVRLAWKGDLSLYRDPLPDNPYADFSRMLYSIYKEDFETALELLEAADHQVMPVRGFQSGLALVKANLVQRTRSMQEAEPLFREALRQLEQEQDEAPDDHNIRGRLASTLAMLGEDAAALREARLAVDQTVADKFFGPYYLESLALVHAIIGEDDAAIDILEKLLTTVYSGYMTVQRLRLEPDWKYFLSDNPRYQALINEET